MHTSREFLTLFRASRERGLIEDFDLTLLEGALHFRDHRVEAIMTPGDDLVAMGRDAPVSELEHVFLASGHSRVPLLGSGIDDVVGFIHAKDLLGLPPGAVDEPVPAGLIREVLRVGADTGLSDLLVEMRRRRLHLAVVEDAVGKTIGLVTLEDVIEQLVGDIRDESDRAVG